MSVSLLLLLLITFLYAGYNLLIKVSTSYVPIESSSTILATIALQVSALAVSCVFVAGLIARGGNALGLPTSAYLWAALAGICIGCAEIAYFYLFRGVADSPPIAANIAIPFVVSGTVVVAIFLAWIFLKEALSWQKAFGMLLIVAGVMAIYLDDKTTGLISSS